MNSNSTPASEATRTDQISSRPTKRRALSPASTQAAQLDRLMKNPERLVHIPTPPKGPSLPPPPEIVANVQGSSAGAGSGEFHVYKASRRREYERLRIMDEEVRKEEETAEFERKKEEMRRKDEEKTAKNRKKRERKKKGKTASEKNAQGGELKNKDRHPAGPSEGGKKAGPDTKDNNRGEGNEVQNALVPVEEKGVVIHDDDE